MTHSFESPAMVALNIPLNHSMHFSNRGHPTKPYHNTVKIRFNYGHPLSLGKESPHIFTKYRHPVSTNTFYGPLSVCIDGF